VQVGPNMWLIVVRSHRLIDGLVIIASVQAQMLWLLLGGRRTRDHDAIQGRLGQLHVGAIGAGDHHADRDALPLGQQVALGAGFAAVGGVAPGGERLAGPPFLPSGALVRQPSAACQVRPCPRDVKTSRLPSRVQIGL